MAGGKASTTQPCVVRTPGTLSDRRAKAAPSAQPGVGEGYQSGQLGGSSSGAGRLKPAAARATKNSSRRVFEQRRRREQGELEGASAYRNGSGAGARDGASWARIRRHLIKGARKRKSAPSPADVAPDLQPVEFSGPKTTAAPLVSRGPLRSVGTPATWGVAGGGDAPKSLAGRDSKRWIGRG